MRIAFWADGGWADGDLLGGSEECVVMLAKELARRGHRVWVINGHNDRVIDGVIYCNDFPRVSLDAVITQRDWRKAAEGHRYAKKSYLYCHDIPVDPHFPAEMVDVDYLLQMIDKVVVLNNYHRNLYCKVPDHQVAVIPIGVLQTPVGSIERDPYRCTYISHPHRGLQVLRSVWPYIKHNVPEASLHAFWWESEHFLEPNEHLGIAQMRALLPHEVNVELSKSSLLTYPCVFAPEISPASTIKAQVYGAVPIVVNKGGMVDTVHFGHRTSMEEFGKSVVTALRSQEWLQAERNKMMPVVSEMYSWQRAAEDFERIIQE